MTTFYWKKDEDIYHWHLQCSQIPIHVRRASDWAICEERPKDKLQCRECREKDIVKKINHKIE